MFVLSATQKKGRREEFPNQVNKGVKLYAVRTTAANVSVRRWNGLARLFAGVEFSQHLLDALTVPVSLRIRHGRQSARFHAIDV